MEHEEILSNYYSRERRWTDNFQLTECAKILDIGCGEGNLGFYLTKIQSASVTGVELVPECAVIASKKLDEVLQVDVESWMDKSRLDSYDYIIFSDSLEHFVNPEKVLLNLKCMLKQSCASSILIAVPNVRNFRVILPLIFNGDWKYENEGLLDKTHLRFFTKKSIFRTLDDCGYQVNECHLELPLKSFSGILNVFTLGLFKNFLTSHYYLKACIKKS